MTVEDVRELSGSKSFESAKRALECDADALGIRGARSFRSHRPNSNRKHRVRHFVTLWADDRPVLVAKCRTDSADDKVGREFRVLRKHGAMSNAGVSAAALSGNDDFFVMRYVPDLDFPDLFRSSDAAARRALMGIAVEEVAAFHTVKAAPLNARNDAALNGFLGDWRPADAFVRSVLARAPAGAMHGDLGPWNLRCDRNGCDVSLIDWEDYRDVGVPILDVLNLLLTLTLLVHPDYADMPGETLYRRTFVEPGEMTALLSDGLHAYSELAGTTVETCLALTPVYCRAMLRRFELEQRPTDHLFYVPFQEHFRLKDALWLTQ